MIKKFFILLLAIVASVGMMNAKVTWNSSNISDLKVRSYQSYSKEGVTLSANSDMVEARWQDLGDESMDGISFNANETGGYTFSNTLGKNFTKIQMTLNGPGGWDFANLGNGWSFYWDYMNDKPATVTWTGNAATVDLAKDASDFNGERVKSIVFYFEGDSEEATTAVTGVTLNKSAAELTVGGENLTLIPTVLPSNATNKEVMWNSDNGYVAVVENGGVVIPVGPGTANITVTTVDGNKSATCVVTVSNPAPTYTVALQDGTVNADKVTLSATSAVEGATVTVTPNEEYEITAFSAYYVVVEDQLGSIYDIDATLNAETGAYSFTMPAANVTIEATIAEKAAPAPTPTVTWNSSNISDLQVNGNSYSKEGITLSPNASNNYAYWLDYGNESQNGIYFYVNATGGHTFSNSLGKNFTKIEMTLNGLDGWYVAYLGSGWNIDGMKVIWTGNASTVDLLTETSSFGGAAGVKSIVFYFEGGSEEPGGGSTPTEVTITQDDFPDHGESISFTKDGVTVSAGEIDGISGYLTGGGSFSTTLGNFTKIEVNAMNIGSLGEGWSGSSTKKTWTGNASSVSFSGNIYGYGELTLKFTIGDAAPAYETVMNLINEIPNPVELTAECKAKIDAAREAFDALSTDDKDLVTNIATLTQAETDYAALNQAEADKAIAKINAIPSPMTSENTKLSVYTKVQDARAAYDALTAEQKALIEAATLKRLTDAEDAFAAISGGAAAGALNGKFTINAGGDQIAFAKGNLQATTTDLGEHWTWGFAANQWDFIGNAAANNAISGNGTVSANGTVDLFGWSTPTTYYGIHNSANSDYYSSDFREWGENITGAEWKTLSPSDWIYIISNRADAAQKHGQATVNGVNGYIFLPDEWELPTGLSFTAKPNNWTANVYDGADWTAMENAGAVFLPKSPWRSGNTINTITYGYYWSSDYNNYSNAMAYYFKEDASITGTGTPRYAGICVRLVTAGGASPIADAQAAVALINAIPTPAEMTPECLNAVKAAREAVDALSEEAASLLDASDLQKLTDAEAIFVDVLNVWISGDCRVILWKDSTMNVQKLPGEGNGAMADYSYVSRAPWYNSHWYSPEPGQIVVTSLTIEEGVTSLTEDAFGWMDGLKTVTIPASVTSIHRDAFYWSKAIDDIYLTADTANLTWGDHGDTSFKPEKATRCHVPSDLLEAYQTKFPEINVTFVGDLAPVDPAAGAAAIVDLINAIGTVEYTDECKAKIDAAREAYDKAVDAVKDLISADDLKKLTDAETEYADLKAAADQAVADPVIEKINNIPQPVELKLATRDSINNARTAYDALTADQKALVSNYDVLEAAEEALAGLNQGGSTPVDIVWDGNTGIASVDPNTTSPAYEGMTVTVGNGSSFSTYQSRLYFTFYSQPNGGYIFANADGTNITKVVIESTTALTSTMTEVDRMGSGWVISNENKTATWTGNADSVSIWKGQSFTNYWVVDKITFTVSGVGATPLDSAQAVKDLIEAIPMPVTLEDACVNAVQAARDAYNALSDAAKGALDDATVQKLNQAITDYTALIQAGADEVIAKINNIPQPVELKLATRDSINNARAAYDALNADQKALVSNYDVLTDAEDAWAQIYPGHEDEMVQAEAVAALIEAIPDPVVLTSECENAINLANDAFGQLSGVQKAMLGESLVQKLTDAVATYKSLADQDAAEAVIARIDAIPSPVVYSAECKEAISDARAAYDALSDEAKALVSADELKKLTDAEAAYAALAAEREANVEFLGKEQTVLYQETIALTKLPNGAPDENGWAFDHWEVMPTPMYAGLHLQAVYRYLITLKPQAYDTLMYSGLAQTLIAAGEAEEGHLEYRIGEGAWDATLPQATDAGTYAIQYKLVRTGHEDFIAPDTVYAQIAKAPVAYTAPVAYDTLVYNYGLQTLVLAGQTNDGTFEYTLTPSNENSWSANLPQGMNAGAYSVYFRVNGDMNHLDSVATDPVVVNIAKRDIVVTAPVAYDTLVYNAAAQALAADATADFGTLQYTLTKDDSESWQTTMAQGTNAGAYTVYYRVPGDANHNDYAPASIEASIAKAPLTITANDSTIIYADAVPEFEASYSGWYGQDGVELVSGLQFATTYEVGSYVGTYDIVPSGATADNYTMTYVNGTLTVNKAHVYVSDAEAQIAKFADGHAGAEVTNNGVLNGIKLNDPIAHVTTAAFSSADVAENLTITLFYELTGDAALLNNYNLDPTSDIFTNEGVIIEPFIPDNEHQPEEGEQVEVKEGIDVYAYGYCDGSGYSLKYHLNSGNPNQYMIDFADDRFVDVPYDSTRISGKDGTIDIEIPVDLPTGDYSMTVYFRDSNYTWLESEPINVSFHVNLPETFVRPLFDNVIALVDTCNCFTDIQWYWRANSSEPWQPIEGATGYYYHVDGKLTGEYFVKANMNGEPTYTCGQADMETLYGETQKASAPVVKAYPNPVVTTTTVTIENSTEWNHNIRIVNLMGAEVMNATFEGDKTSVEMSGYPQGNYMISVDGIVVKVMKQ